MKNFVYVRKTDSRREMVVSGDGYRDRRVAYDSWPVGLLLSMRAVGVWSL